MRRFGSALVAAGVLAMLPGCCGTCSTCRKPLFSGGLFNRNDNGRLGVSAPSNGTDPLLIPPPAGGLPTPTIDTPPTRANSTPADDLPPVSQSNKPAETRNGRELILPDPPPAESSSQSKKRLLEDPSEIRKAGQPMPKKSLAGVAGFVQVRDGVATGRKPSMEGFESLQQAGYRTIIYLYSPASDASAAKEVAEKRGFTFVAIPVSPQTLKDAYPLFAAAVNDSTKPAYICDDDGLRTGWLWYVSFRKVDGLGDDEAQVRAAPLGLRDTSGDEKARFWAAVQEYTAK